MKSFSLLLFFVFAGTLSFSQSFGETCADPILINCNNTITSTPTPASNLTALTGNDYSCLSSGPADTTNLKIGLHL